MLRRGAHRVSIRMPCCGRSRAGPVWGGRPRLRRGSRPALTPNAVHLMMFRGGRRSFYVACQRSPKAAGSKNLPLRRDAGRDCAAFYPIAEFAELLDHASGACALGFSADRGTAFLIVGFPAQEEPNESAESMGDSPNGFFVFHSAG